MFQWYTDKYKALDPDQQAEQLQDWIDETHELENKADRSINKEVLAGRKLLRELFDIVGACLVCNLIFSDTVAAYSLTG